MSWNVIFCNYKKYFEIYVQLFTNWRPLETLIFIVKIRAFNKPWVFETTHFNLHLGELYNICDIMFATKLRTHVSERNPDHSKLCTLLFVSRNPVFVKGGTCTWRTGLWGQTCRSENRLVIYCFRDEHYNCIAQRNTIIKFLCIIWCASKTE